MADTAKHRRRTATYVLRFTPEEKAELEQKVRIAAAMRQSPLSLAEACRQGAQVYLDGLIGALGAADGEIVGSHAMARLTDIRTDSAA